MTLKQTQMRNREKILESAKQKISSKISLSQSLISFVNIGNMYKEFYRLTMFNITVF